MTIVANEELAAYAHEAWVRTVMGILGFSMQNTDGSATIPRYLVERLMRQGHASYHELQEEEKNYNRKEAVRIMQIVLEGKHE